MELAWVPLADRRGFHQIVSEPDHAHLLADFNGSQVCRSSCRCLACSAPGRAASLIRLHFTSGAWHGPAT
jgi:hypothetical protein